MDTYPDTERPPFNLTDADYERFGRYFHVEVPVKRLRHGRLVWLNNDWFQSHGIDMRQAAARSKIEDWILRTYCVTTRINGETPTHRMRADRYGGPTGTAHGGSGRCVYLDQFNAKGVGPTPLVPEGLPTHSDGKYLLSEALRCAIYAELCDLQTACGAVRTVAIIDVGAGGPVDNRTCISVRPNFVRPAHFERSLFFGTAGHADSDQFRDRLRVDDVLAVLKADGLDICMLVEKLALAIGSLDAMRMAQGRFTSSNMTLDGKVADLESFRVFDTWRYAGNERRDRYPIGKDLLTLSFCAKRWCQRLSPSESATTVDEVIERGHFEGFGTTFRNMLYHDPGTPGRFRAKLIDKLFSVFANSRKNIRSPDAWIVEPKLSADDYCSRARRELLQAGASMTESVVNAARLNIWRSGADALSYRNVATVCRNVAESGDGSIIDSLVDVSRRMYRLPASPQVPLLVFSEGNTPNIVLRHVETGDVSVVSWSSGRGGMHSPIEPTVKSVEPSFVQSLQKRTMKEAPLVRRFGNEALLNVPIR